MNAHKNAGTTPHIRVLMVRRVLEEGRSPGSVALDVGVSERTVHKWLARYRAEAVAGLENRSSAPRTVANRLPEPWVEMIARLRRSYRMTAMEIGKQLRIARSTVAAILKRLGLASSGARGPVRAG